MKDVSKPVRLAFHTLLNGNLESPEGNVPVSDEMLVENANYYVLLSSQSATPDETKHSFDCEATITIIIVHKQGRYVTKDGVDDIADQILTLLRPTPNTHSLIAPATWQFLNLRKEVDRHDSMRLNPTTTEVSRTMVFGLRVVQN
jgi:hypothetical protein